MSRFRLRLYDAAGVPLLWSEDERNGSARGRDWAQSLATAFAARNGEGARVDILQRRWFRRRLLVASVVNRGDVTETIALAQRDRVRARSLE